MSDSEGQSLKEQNAQELIIAAKIIAAILIGLLCGLGAYFAFKGIVPALIAAPLAGGLLIGLFFADEEHRKAIASVICACFIGAIILFAIVHTKTESFASFFAYIGGFACIVSVLALIAIVGFITQASNVNAVTVSEESGTTNVCIIILVISFMVWFSCRSIVQLLRPDQPMQIAVITPEDEQEAHEKFLNSSTMREAQRELRQEADQKRELQNAKTLRDQEQAARELEKSLLVEKEKEAYFASRVLAMAIAFKANAGVSKMVQDVNYYNKRARFTVKDSWHFLPYQLRLQAAQDLGAMWSQFAQSNEPQMFDIADLNGNRVGGRSLFGVWVQKE